MKVGFIILFMGVDGFNLYIYFLVNVVEFFLNSFFMMDRLLVISFFFIDV